MPRKQRDYKAEYRRRVAKRRPDQTLAEAVGHKKRQDSSAKSRAARTQKKWKRLPAHGKLHPIQDGQRYRENRPWKFRWTFEVKNNDTGSYRMVSVESFRKNLTKGEVLKLFLELLDELAQDDYWAEFLADSSWEFRLYFYSKSTKAPRITGYGPSLSNP